MIMILAHQPTNTISKKSSLEYALNSCWHEFVYYHFRRRDIFRIGVFSLIKIYQNSLIPLMGMPDQANCWNELYKWNLGSLRWDLKESFAVPVFLQQFWPTQSNRLSYIAKYGCLSRIHTKANYYGPKPKNRVPDFVF